MARNRQVPRQSESVIVVASEVILRETARRHLQWHQVGGRGILLQRASSALRTRAITGVIVVLEGGDLPRVADLRGLLLLSSSSTRLRTAIPGPPDQGRVERLHKRTVQVDVSFTTASAPVAAPAVPSASAPGAMPAAAPGVSSIRPWSAGWSVYPPAVPFESSGASPPAQLARPWHQVGIAAPRNADEVAVEFEDKYVPAELCLPGQRSRGTIALRAILDSGAHFTNLSLPIVQMMERRSQVCRCAFRFLSGRGMPSRRRGRKFLLQSELFRCSWR